MLTGRRGFTLIEMLLALMLTSLLTAALSMMIGQAAREREAMREEPDQPIWAPRLMDLLERDLRQAQWWAGSDDRLVVIGLGRNGLPAQVEYRWIEHESANSLTRQEVTLTETVRQSPESAHVIGLDLQGLKAGPFMFGERLNQDDSASRPKVDRNLPTLLIEGRQVPLKALPEQIEIELLFYDARPSLHREGILR